MPIACAYLNSFATNSNFMFGNVKLHEPDLETFGEAILGLKEDGDSAIVVAKTHKPGVAPQRNAEFMFGGTDGQSSAAAANDDLLNLWSAALA